MSLLDYAKKHKMKDYDKSFKVIRNIKEEPGLMNQIKVVSRISYPVEKKLKFLQIVPPGMVTFS